MKVIKSFPRIANRHFIGHSELVELQTLKEGCAYLTKENYVIKEAKSFKEYEMAQAMKGHQSMHIVDVYDCYEDNGRYYILEEYLTKDMDFNLLLRFSDCYRMSWFRLGYYSEMRDVIAREKHRKIEDVLNLFKNLTNNDKYYEQLFHITCKAITELYCLCPNAWLDTNATNIGFTKGNIMKFFDIELCDFP